MYTINIIFVFVSDLKIKSSQSPDCDLNWIASNTSKSKSCLISAYHHHHHTRQREHCCLSDHWRKWKWKWTKVNENEGRLQKKSCFISKKVPYSKWEVHGHGTRNRERERARCCAKRCSASWASPFLSFFICTVADNFWTRDGRFSASPHLDLVASMRVVVVHKYEDKRG